jgi:hypothetical protein
VKLGRALITQFQEAAMPIDAAFIERITSIPVVRSPARSGKRKPRVKEHASRTWLVGVHQLDEDATRTKRRAGVTLQTLRRYGSKSGLNAAAAAEAVRRIEAQRVQAPVCDVRKRSPLPSLRREAPFALPMSSKS